jgi:hypothetical protein
MERHHRVLELIGPKARDDVRRDQHERITDRHLAPPYLGLEAVRRQAPLPMWIRQGREPGLADQIGLGRAHCGHVHLVATHDPDADADRAVALG